jgi:photoactive yellow protein
MTDDLSALTAADIDALPFGYIALAPDGTVRKYNRFEADLARKDPQTVLGRNFFREVAPCTQVREFEGRFREMTAGAPGSGNAESFDFEFGFRHGTQKVRISLVRSPLASEVIVTVNRVRRLELPAEPRLAVDAARGRLADAAGRPVTLAGEDFWRALLGLWPEPAGREALHRLGRAWGQAHAERVERQVQRSHGVTLREAELQMALEALSGSLLLLGLGRFDVDFTWRRRGLLLIRHHHSPFVELAPESRGASGTRQPGTCEPLAGLHAGFLSHLSGRQLAGAEMRCSRRPEEPCVFLVGTQGRLQRLLGAPEGTPDGELRAAATGAAPAASGA